VVAFIVLTDGNVFAVAMGAFLVAATLVVVHTVSYYVYWSFDHLLRMALSITATLSTIAIPMTLFGSGWIFIAVLAAIVTVGILMFITSETKKEFGGNVALLFMAALPLGVGTVIGGAILLYRWQQRRRQVPTT